MGDLESLIGLSASALGVLLPAFKLVEQMTITYKTIRFAKARCKTVIRRAALIIKGAYESARKTGLEIPSSHLKELHHKFEDIRAIMQKLAEMSFLKALLRSDLIGQEIEMANGHLSDCLRIFQIDLLFHAPAEKDSAAKLDRNALQDMLIELKGNYTKIRRVFGINSDEEEDQAILAMERKLGDTEQSSQDTVETKIIKSTLECIKSSTGKSTPKQSSWLITEYELDFGGQIGGGGFSTVRKAKFRGTTVAVKVLKDIGNSKKALEREIDIWSRLRHDHIVPFYGASTLTSTSYIVCRYMRNGNLIQHMSKNPTADRTKLIYEISLGMFYLHGEKIVHGDLKGVNVLVDDAGKACITDFGLSSFSSTVLARGTTNRISGTLRYLAPEALEGQPLNFATDIYAFGMVIYEVFTGEGPFIRVPDHLVGGDLKISRPTSNEVLARGLSDAMWQLVLDTTARNPCARPPFAAIAKLLEQERESLSQVLESADVGTRRIEHVTNCRTTSPSTFDNSNSLPRKVDFSPDNSRSLSGSSLVDFERPMCADVISKYFNVEFGLVNSREPGVCLHEIGSTYWQPVSAKKGSLLRVEGNRFTYRRTIGSGANSWELDGNKVVLHSSSIDAQCCFRDPQLARKWFELQMSYARNGSLNEWGSFKVTGDWITKARGWRRIFRGKLQISSSLEETNPTPSSWSNLDLPKHYTIAESDKNNDSITCVVNPESPRPSKVYWSMQGRTVIFANYRLIRDEMPTLRREEIYISEAEARVMFTAIKVVLEKGKKPGTAQLANTILSRNASQVAIAETQQKYTPGIGGFKQWLSDSSPDMNMLFPDTAILRSTSDAHNMLSYNSLLASRSRDWNSACENATKSISIRPSVMGYVALALAQAGMGKPEEALHTYDLVFQRSDPSENSLLSLAKIIILFISGRHHDAITRMLHLVSHPNNLEDETMYCYLQVLGKMLLMEEEYTRAANLLKQGQSLASSKSSCQGDLETLTLIFGWRFDELQITAQRYHCEAMLRAGRAQEVIQPLQEILESYRTSKTRPKWVTDLCGQCVKMLEDSGDEAFSSGKPREATAQYSDALSFRLPNPSVLLVKRSKARALEGLWEGALTDANEVIKLDPSSHWGYERKHVALHGAKRYREAITAAIDMLERIENSSDQDINRLRKNYTAPRETKAIIDSAVHAIFKLCPLVLIDVTTGRLCDADERVAVFHSETPYEKLVSEAVTKGAENTVPDAVIVPVVAKYFEWVMFSHTWEGKEPTFQEVNLAKSVWSLDASPLNGKLKQFCITTRESGYRWAWSDTCCIDKSTSAVLSQSLTSMYNWYARAAATLVYLVDVLPLAELGGLTGSRWMTRAWTLQELLASKVIRFYDRKWKPYLNDVGLNHKESPVIKGELARAMGVAPETITSFQPEDLSAWEKLRLASTRVATVDEDVAYSLIGIFSSDIIPRYGVGDIALGELLGGIVAGAGDITVAAWTGTSSKYNSALPSSLAVYGQTPCGPPSMEAGKLETLVEQLQAEFPRESTLKFYRQITRLPRATFSNRCLQLPCIAFPVMKISRNESGDATHYCARAWLLGKVEFRTADEIPMDPELSQKFIFAHPWLHELRDPGSIPDDDDESDTELGPVFGQGNDTTTMSFVAPLRTEQLDRYSQALRLIARLCHSFNALLLERQSNGQYKRVATEYEIIVPEGPRKASGFNNIRVKTLEIV